MQPWISWIGVELGSRLKHFRPKVGPVVPPGGNVVTNNKATTTAYLRNEYPGHRLQESMTWCIAHSMVQCGPGTTAFNGLSLVTYVIFLTFFVFGI